jgi:hypothetical protein
MLSGISSFAFSSGLGMTMFFSEILGVLNELGMTCSAFTLGAVETAVATEGATGVGVSVVDVVTADSCIAEGVVVVSVGVGVTPLLFFLKGQLRWTARL